MTSLKQQASTGVKWTGTASILVTTLQFTQLAILARVLTPEDFGLMAMVMVIIGFAQAYADMGISSAIIHRQDATRNELSSLYWLNILAGILVFGLVVAAAPLAVDLFSEPRVHDLMVLTAFIFLVSPFGQQFQILLQKNLRFKTLGIIDVGSAVIRATTGISCALAGQGVYSLVWAELASTAAKTLALLILGWREWRPELRFRQEDFKGYLSFGLYQLGERTGNYFGSRLDQLLIGTLLGTQALGFYSLAFNLVMQPVLRLNPIFIRVAFPLFARLQSDPDRIKHGYMTLQRVLAMLNFPILIGFAAVAPIFVKIILGEQWTESVLLIQILAFVALMRSMGNPVGSLLLAKGRADLGFYWTLLFFVTQVPTVYFGATYGGVLGVVTALLVMQMGLYWANYFINVRTLLGSCLGLYLKSTLPAAVTAGLMGLGVWGFSEVISSQSWVSLALQIFVGILLYFALNFLLFRREMHEAFRLIQTKNA